MGFGCFGFGFVWIGLVFACLLCSGLVCFGFEFSSWFEFGFEFWVLGWIGVDCSGLSCLLLVRSVVASVTSGSLVCLIDDCFADLGGFYLFCFWLLLLFDLFGWFRWVGWWFLGLWWFTFCLIVGVGRRVVAFEAWLLLYDFVYTCGGGLYCFAGLMVFGCVGLP